MAALPNFDVPLKAAALVWQLTNGEPVDGAPFAQPSLVARSGVTGAAAEPSHGYGHPAHVPGTRTIALTLSSTATSGTVLGYTVIALPDPTEHMKDGVSHQLGEDIEYAANKFYTVYWSR